MPLEGVNGTPLGDAGGIGGELRGPPYFKMAAAIRGRREWKASEAAYFRAHDLVVFACWGLDPQRGFHFEGSSPYFRDADFFRKLDGAGRVGWSGRACGQGAPARGRGD